MARPPRRCVGDKQQQRRRRRRLYILSDHDGDSGVSIYKLNEDGFDSDDAYYSKDAGHDDSGGSVCSSNSEGYFATRNHFDSEYDVDSRARRLRHRRLVARVATRGCPKFVAAGTKIVGLHSSTYYHHHQQAAAASFIFDVGTRLVSATPPFRSPKKSAKFWAIGGTVYALDTRADDDDDDEEPNKFKDMKERCCVFERLGPEPRRHYGSWSWQWEALPRPPFKLDNIIVSRAVHPEGATVFLSVYETGTFSFDADRMEWARHGDWVLPFDGEAFYVGDLDAWVGLSSRHRGRLAACRVVDVDDRRRQGAPPPASKCGRDLLFREAWRRHDRASLVYMGNARFCLLETVTDGSDTAGLIVPMLLRVVTFRVQYSWDGELCVVNRRAKVYKLPWQSSSEKPRAFWI